MSTEEKKPWERTALERILHLLDELQVPYSCINVDKKSDLFINAEFDKKGRLIRPTKKTL